MEPILPTPRIPASFKVNSPHVKYTEDTITSDYTYRTVKTKYEDGEIVCEPLETKYTFRTERKLPKLG